MKFALLFIALFALASAKPGFGPTDQEWDHEQVRPGAYMFWWLHYTTACSNPAERPLIIWLQGGPGFSSTGYGNFLEIGPQDENLDPRTNSWVNDANILFVDAPVGSGFSYTTGNNKLSTTNQAIALDLVEVLRGFYTKVPALAGVPVYIAGESYGAKIAVQFAKELLQSTVTADLQGLLLSNPWVSPVDNVLSWGKYLQYFSVIDPEGYDSIEIIAEETKQAVDNNQWNLAYRKFAQTQKEALKQSDHVNFYNILKKMTKTDVLLSKVDTIIGPYLPGGPVDRSVENTLKPVMASVKSTLSLPRKWGSQQSRVFPKLQNDFMKPVKSIVEDLLNNHPTVKIFVMNGQLDAIVNTPGTLRWVDTLTWTGAADYASETTTPRGLVVIDNVNVCYEKVHDNFAMFWINRGTHFIPASNPVGAHYVLKKLTNDFAV